MKEKFKIIFLTEQIGGFDVFLPVIKKIQNNKKFSVSVFLDNKNIYKFAKKQKIKCQYLPNYSLEKIEKIIKIVNPDIIFVDTNNTDLNLSISKKFIKTAKKMNKKTVSIIDFWTNYKERFGKKLEYLTDTVLVIDKEMKKHLNLKRPGRSGKLRKK